MNPHQRNTAIENLIDRKTASGESFSWEEREFISTYEGAGGLSKHGAKGAGLLSEFYTPSWLGAKVWELVLHYGYDGGPVLEPACGTGRLLKDAPLTASITAFEVNPYAATITKALFPKANLFEQHFETAFLQGPRFTSKLKNEITWLMDAPFSLVISNPPYGRYSGPYATHFKKEGFKQFESFFIYKSLQLLRPGGLLAFIIPSGFMRSGNAYQKEKENIGQLAQVIDAYLLPPIFKHTTITTDILILRRT